jgi:hypothetical protein
MSNSNSKTVSLFLKYVGGRVVKWLICWLLTTNLIMYKYIFIIYFEQNQKYLIPSYFRKRLTLVKFKHVVIMNLTKKSNLLKLCKIIKAINEGVCAPG